MHPPRERAARKRRPVELAITDGDGRRESYGDEQPDIDADGVAHCFAFADCLADRVAHVGTDDRADLAADVAAHSSADDRTDATTDAASRDVHTAADVHARADAITDGTSDAAADFRSDAHGAANTDRIADGVCLSVGFAVTNGVRLSVGFALTNGVFVTIADRYRDRVPDPDADTEADE